jgi:hypothetical protein
LKESIGIDARGLQHADGFAVSDCFVFALIAPPPGPAAKFAAE